MRGRLWEWFEQGDAGAAVADGFPMCRAPERLVRRLLQKPHCSWGIPPALEMHRQFRRPLPGLSPIAGLEAQANLLMPPRPPADGPLRVEQFLIERMAESVARRDGP